MRQVVDRSTHLTSSYWYLPQFPPPPSLPIIAVPLLSVRGDWIILRPNSIRNSEVLNPWSIHTLCTTVGRVHLHLDEGSQNLNIPTFTGISYVNQCCSGSAHTCRSGTLYSRVSLRSRRNVARQQAAAGRNRVSTEKRKKQLF